MKYIARVEDKTFAIEVQDGGGSRRIIQKRRKTSNPSVCAIGLGGLRLTHSGGRVCSVLAAKVRSRG